MANTPHAGFRIPPKLVDEARRGTGIPDAPVSLLVRAGLAVLAGRSRADALREARMRPGPKPRTGDAA